MTRQFGGTSRGGELRSTFVGWGVFGRVVRRATLLTLVRLQAGAGNPVEPVKVSETCNCRPLQDTFCWGPTGFQSLVAPRCG